VQKTGRLIVVAEAPQSFSVGSELMAIANEEAFLYLEAPPKRVMGFDTIVPLAKGESFYVISPERIFYEIERTVQY
jgi:pyruvate dehydrogenase E1 component beta subunit